MRIGIIGGGIAGLAAAYELEKARSAGQQVQYTLYESQPRLGGVLASETVNGSVIELGPDSFLTEKPSAGALCHELGLGAELLPSNDAARKTWIVVKNRLVPLPDGLMFLAPTKLLPTALTPLFGLRTKIRMGLELLHPPRAAEGDESVAAFVARHYGSEVVERLADPLLTGIYGGRAAELSARAVLPRLVEMEQKYGSLTRAALKMRQLRARQQVRDTGENAVANATSSAGRGIPSVFTTLRGGMRQLVDAVAARIDAQSVVTATTISSIEKTSDGWRICANGQTMDLEALIVATPAWAAAELLAPVDALLGEELNSIPYTSSTTVNLAYDERRIGRLPEGFGFLVPASEGHAMLACTFVHRKFPGRAAPGKAILRAFLGGSRRESERDPLPDQSDEQIVATVRRELNEILGEKTFSASVAPEFTRVARWPRAMAQYAVGHRERIQRIAAHVKELPGLRLAGNAYDGIGISDCIRLGRKAALELLAGKGSPGDQQGDQRTGAKVTPGISA